MKYYKATFSSGYVAARSTAERAYTHAVASIRLGRVAHVSWAGSADLAHARSRAFAASEIAEAVEIAAAEYRTINKANQSAAQARRAAGQ